MTYQVCVLNSADEYRVIFASEDGNATLDFYDAMIAEDFATVYPTVANTFNLVIPAFIMTTAEMTGTQLTNLSVMVANPVEFSMTVCF